MDVIAPLKPLPKLKVVQETYVSQEMTDRIIAYLEEHHQEDLDRVRQFDTGSSNGVTLSTYAEMMGVVMDHVSKVMEVPDPNVQYEGSLAYIDLAFELCRRYRTAYGYEVPVLKGHPLAASPKGPFPPLAGKKIYSRFAKYNLDQETVDEIVAAYYAEYPEWSYVQGEAYRREQAPDIVVGSVPNSFFHVLLLQRRQVEKKDLFFVTLDLRNEVQARITKSCGISVVEN